MAVQDADLGKAFAEAFARKDVAGVAAFSIQRSISED